MPLEELTVEELLKLVWPKFKIAKAPALLTEDDKKEYNNRLWNAALVYMTNLFLDLQGIANLNKLNKKELMTTKSDADMFILANADPLRIQQNYIKHFDFEMEALEFCLKQQNILLTEYHANRVSHTTTAYNDICDKLADHDIISKEEDLPKLWESLTDPSAALPVAANPFLKYPKFTPPANITIDEDLLKDASDYHRHIITSVMSVLNEKREAARAAQPEKPVEIDAEKDQEQDQEIVNDVSSIAEAFMHHLLSNQSELRAKMDILRSKLIKPDHQEIFDKTLKEQSKSMKCKIEAPTPTRRPVKEEPNNPDVSNKAQHHNVKKYHPETPFEKEKRLQQEQYKEKK